jgi:uncharacterized protein (UPF0332 family)
MSIEYDDCLKRGKIKPFSRCKYIAASELKSARADLERAKKTAGHGDIKWATVQLYYSMFHKARALLYGKNLREHSHYCLIEALRVLYVEKGQIPLTYAEALEEAKALREDADCYNRWSTEAYENMLNKADAFLSMSEDIIKKDAG